MLKLLGSVLFVSVVLVTATHSASYPSDIITSSKQIKNLQVGEGGYVALGIAPGIVLQITETGEACISAFSQVEHSPPNQIWPPVVVRKTQNGLVVDARDFFNSLKEAGESFLPLTAHVSDCIIIDRFVGSE